MLANLTDQTSVVVSTNRIVATTEVHNARRVGVLTKSELGWFWDCSWFEGDPKIAQML